MAYKSIGILFIALFFSGKVLSQNKTGHTPPAATPGACSIEGRIVKIIRPAPKDKDGICSKYPCRARVKVMQLFGCGAAVSAPLNAGDTIEMKFAYTLHSTEIFPNMKTYFPGLKKGSLFVANVSQRQVMGATGEFVIYDYEVK